MNKIHKLSLADRKLMLELLNKLIKADTTNPPGNEYRVAEVVASFLKCIGIPFFRHAKKPGRTNILWNLAAHKRKEILVAAHSDTVPPGDDWKTDPFELVKRKGELIGRGVVDNKGVLAALLVATKILKKIEKDLPCRIVFGSVADEEAGSEFGMKYLLKKKYVKPDLSVIPDVCGENRLVMIAEKGLINLKVTAHGLQGHGSMPEKSINAIYVMDDFLHSVRKLKFTKKTKTLNPVTISIGAVHAGTVANIIPGKAESLLDIRRPPNEAAEDILKKLKKIATRVAKKWKTKSFDFKIIHQAPPSETDEKHYIVSSTVDSIKKITKKKPKIVGIPAFTVAGFLRAEGVPTVSFAPGELSECHRSNEHMPEKQLYEFAEILIELLKNIELQ